MGLKKGARERPLPRTLLAQLKRSTLLDEFPGRGLPVQAMRPDWFAAIISIREPEFTGFYLHFFIRR
jgi:hypothetical protein